MPTRPCPKCYGIEEKAKSCPLCKGRGVVEVQAQGRIDWPPKAK